MNHSTTPLQRIVELAKGGLVSVTEGSKRDALERILAVASQAQMPSEGSYIKDENVMNINVGF
jgi:hypothetical protein